MPAYIGQDGKVDVEAFSYTHLDVYKRQVNTYTGDNEKKGEDFSKIKIVDAMHLIKDDIRDTFDKYYVGKVSNTYANKQQFIAMINRVYFAELKGLVLQDTDKNRVDINIEENLRYAVKRGACLLYTSLPYQEIKLRKSLNYLGRGLIILIIFGIMRIL